MYFCCLSTWCTGPRKDITFPTSFLSPGCSDNHVYNSNATISYSYCCKQQKKKCSVLIFLLHKNTVLTALNPYTFFLLFKGFEKYTNVVVVFSMVLKIPLLYTDKANFWRANTANLFLATTNLFFVFLLSRAQKIMQDLGKQCTSSPQVSFYLVCCLIHMIITLFFKLRHLPHIYIFKILSFLERDAYNPQAVKIWCILSIKSPGR